MGSLYLIPETLRLLGCAVCFGDPESPLTAGLNMGILSLLGVLVFVLALFGKFFLALRKRAKENGLT